MVETLNSLFKSLVKYSAYHWVYSLVGGYFVLSIVLFAYLNIDIGIPCLFKLAIGLKCPGCGLTHAFAHISRFEFAEAWGENKLSFLVLPLGLFYLFKDFSEFHQRELE